MICSRHGSCMNSSAGGNGMCRKKPIRRSGRRSRSSGRARAAAGSRAPRPSRPRPRPRRRPRRTARLTLTYACHQCRWNAGGDDDVVVERPERAVGEALVVVLHVLGREVDRVAASRPSSSNGSACASASPGQPTHAPRRERRIGSSAVTSPPGLRCQFVRAVGQRARGRRAAGWPPPRTRPFRCPATTHLLSGSGRPPSLGRVPMISDCGRRAAPGPTGTAGSPAAG